MMIKKLTTVVSLLIFSIINLHATTKNKEVTDQTVDSVKTKSRIINIPFNKRNKIVYYLNSGKLDVYYGNVPVFKDIFASVKYTNNTLTTRSYPSRTYRKDIITDVLGKAEKHTITLNGKGLPTLKQIFYTYTDKPYFFTELELNGYQLQSNYMAPWEGNFEAMQGENSAVRVPFDNDTFISYESNRFGPAGMHLSAEVGLIYNNHTRAGIVAGSVEHGTWKSGVRFLTSGPTNSHVAVWAGFSNQALTRDSIAHGLVKGDKIKSPKMMIGYFADWRTAMEEYGKANRRADPPFVANWTAPTPVGWNSWGVIQEKLNYDNATKVADFFADSIATFRTGNTAYIDLDSYWDHLIKGDDYTQLKKFADYCKSKGLQPGIYWAPFTDWGYKGGPSRKVQSTNYTYGELWTKVGNKYHNIDGARALDPTHPGTLKRIDYFTSIFRDCGFKMIKIDFLGHAAVESTHFYDSTVTTGMQAYRKGMEYLINHLNGMFIYAAISPSLATGRYVHSRRIACDAFQTIDHTQYTLNSVTYGWWQTYLYNYLDADHVVLDHQTDGENRARFLSSVITGTLITGDDFSRSGPWSAKAKAWYQNPEFLKVVKNGKAFAPVEGGTGKGAASIFSRKIGNKLYVALFNYSATPKPLTLSPKRLGLSASHTYTGTELFANQKMSLHGDRQIVVTEKNAIFYKFDLQ